MTQKNRTLEDKNRTLVGRGLKRPQKIGHHLWMFLLVSFIRILDKKQTQFFIKL